MTLAVQAVPVGARLIDTVTPITVATAHALKAAGVDGVIRYGGSLTSEELLDCVDAGLGVMLVGYSRGEGWIPSAQLGDQDGTTAATHAKEAGLVLGTNVWCDVEGCGGNAADVIAYCEAWYAVVKAAGFVPGVYVGAGNLLTAQQLMALPFTAYWKSLSAVEAPSVGFQMYQLYPSTNVAGILVDYDFVNQDFAHRVPHWTVASSQIAAIPLPFQHDTEPPPVAA